MLFGPRTVIYHVKDITKAKEWYSTLLGKPPYFDEPYYVGFSIEGFELGLQPEEGSISFNNSAIAYWGVKNAKDVYEHLLKGGSIANEPILDVGGGILLGTVIDPCGNVFGIIENPHFVYSPAE